LKPKASTDITCRHCGHANAAERKFCADCGKALSAACPECDCECGLEDKFCGQCGANIQAVAESQQRDIERMWEEAQQLHSEHRHGEALALLGSAAAMAQRYARLEDYRVRTLERMQQVSEDRARQTDRAKQSTDKARQHLAEHAYADALAELARIPEPLRDEGCQQLAVQAEDALQQARSLRRQIQEALRAKQTTGLLPKVSEYLSLNPDDSQASELARKLAQLHLRAAKKKVGQHQYEDALSLLNQVPEGLQSDESRRLSEHVAELHCLWTDLVTAPYVDTHLVGVARRLSRLDPHNPKAAELGQRLMRHVNGHPHRLPDARRPWCASPEPTHVGVPVDQRVSFSSLANPEVDAGQDGGPDATLFSVAAGLALQGLNKVPIRTNLLPKPKTNLRDRVSNLMRKSPPVRSAWGIDLGSSHIKAVKLTCDEAGGPMMLSASRLVPLEFDACAEQDEAGRFQLLRRGLETLQSGTDLTADKMVIGLPGGSVLGRYFALPPMDPKKIDSAVRYEVKQQIPFPESALIWDYHVFHPRSGLATSKPVDASVTDLQPHIFLTGVRERDVERLLSIFHELDIRVDQMQSNSTALYNLTTFEQWDAGQPIAMVDVGHQSTNIVIRGSDLIWSRTFRVGSKDVTHALVRELKVTRSTAERLKQEPLSIRRLSKLSDALRPVLVEVAKEIRLSLNSFQQTYPHLSVAKLYLLGGGARTYGLLRFLRNGV
jgi:type IV pilus assembly protein PilM